MRKICEGSRETVTIWACLKAGQWVQRWKDPAVLEEEQKGDSVCVNEEVMKEMIQWRQGIGCAQLLEENSKGEKQKRGTFFQSANTRNRWNSVTLHEINSSNFLFSSAKTKIQRSTNALRGPTRPQLSSEASWLNCPSNVNFWFQRERSRRPWVGEFWLPPWSQIMRGPIWAGNNTFLVSAFNLNAFGRDIALCESPGRISHTQQITPAQAHTHTWMEKREPLA